MWITVLKNAGRVEDHKALGEEKIHIENVYKTTLKMWIMWIT